MNLNQLKKHLKIRKTKDLPLETRFAFLVKTFRVQHGLSPEKFCKLVGIGIKTLNKLEEN